MAARNVCAGLPTRRLGLNGDWLRFRPLVDRRAFGSRACRFPPSPKPDPRHWNDRRSAAFTAFSFSPGERDADFVDRAAFHTTELQKSRVLGL
ncbi:MAG: hypothetical protein AAF317_11290, partial [Pseudomonadota bacterium]